MTYAAAHPKTHISTAATSSDRLQRAVGRASLQLALETHQQRNREVVSGVKEDLDRRVGRDLTKRLERVSPMKEEDQLVMSRQLNEAMSMFPDKATREWFKLFQHMGAPPAPHAPAASPLPPRTAQHSRDRPCPQTTTAPVGSATRSSPA